MFQMRYRKTTKISLSRGLKVNKKESYTFNITFNKSYRYFQLNINQPPDKLHEDIKVIEFKSNL